MTANKMRTAASLATAAMLLLAGCDQLKQDTWTPQESDAISIDQDGRITEYIQETLDAGYYSASELETMVNDEVASYNAANGEDSIQITEMVSEGTSFRLTMEYASALDYAQFNNTEFYYGSMINAQLEGYLFDVSYKQVSDGVVQGSSVSGSEVIKAMDKQVLILRAPLEVHVPGSVLFTSTNAEVLASNVVNATGESEEDVQELVLPSNEVYRSSDTHSFAEEEAENRVYIIFDETE